MRLLFLLGTVLIAICMMAIISCKHEMSQDDPEISALSLQTIENPCSQAQGICENQVWLLDTLDIILPEYPNCVFKVEYSAKLCPHTFEADVKLLKYWSDLFCDEWDQDIDSVANAQGNITLWIYRFEKKLMIEIATIIGFSYNTICGVDQSFLASFTNAACSKRCIVRVPKPDGGYTYRAITIFCGEGCCETLIEVCIDPITQSPVTTVLPSSPANPTNCFSFSAQLQCPYNTIYSGPCAVTCGNL